jgi:hypothetical protein
VVCDFEVRVLGCAPRVMAQAVTDISGHVSDANCQPDKGSNSLFIDGRENPLFID